MDLTVFPARRLNGGAPRSHGPRARRANRSGRPDSPSVTAEDISPSTSFAAWMQPFGWSLRFEALPGAPKADPLRDARRTHQEFSVLAACVPRPELLPGDVARNDAVPREIPEACSTNRAQGGLADRPWLNPIYGVAWYWFETTRAPPCLSAR